MKKLLSAFVFLVFLFGVVDTPVDAGYVRSYTRKDGTRVSGYYRSSGSNHKRSAKSHRKSSGKKHKKIVASKKYSDKRSAAPQLPKGMGGATAIEKRWWAEGSKTEFRGMQVAKRNTVFDPNVKDGLGRTNVERMREGLSPIGKDGKEVELHHVRQKASGPLIELSNTEHKQNSGKIHQKHESEIDRKAFNEFRTAYWKQRANDF